MVDMSRCSMTDRKGNAGRQVFTSFQSCSFSIAMPSVSEYIVLVSSAYLCLDRGHTAFIVDKGKRLGGALPDCEWFP